MPGDTVLAALAYRAQPAPCAFGRLGGNARCCEKPELGEGRRGKGRNLVDVAQGVRRVGVAEEGGIRRGPRAAAVEDEENRAAHGERVPKR